MQLEHSWFWPVLSEYQDSQGRALEEAEHDWVKTSNNPCEVIDSFIAQRKWRWSPTSERFTGYIIELIESFRDREEPFRYLEFGTCFGTTIASVLRHFRQARGIGLEIIPSRFDVTRWLIGRVDHDFRVSDRIDLRPVGLYEAQLEANSVDVVFMDTDHRYPDDHDYIRYLLDGDILRPGFLFIGDDPMHTGTKLARERFIQENDGRYHIETLPQENLWWFRRA